MITAVHLLIANDHKVESHQQILHTIFDSLTAITEPNLKNMKTQHSRHCNQVGCARSS